MSGGLFDVTRLLRWQYGDAATDEIPLILPSPGRREPAAGLAGDVAHIVTPRFRRSDGEQVGAWRC
ncbi:hypothetical protein [Nonomuraea jabiensis]|uniref:hypothetical protein n=1 Tax=Nonomuraea jabiensis TaxID=882448 RepID=UPI0036C2C95F